MKLAIDKYFYKLASQGDGIRSKRIPSPSRSRNCDDYFEGEICFGNHDPKMFVRGRLCEGVRSPFSKMSPAPRTRSRLRIDKYFNDCLEKEAQSKHIPNHFHGKAFSDPKKRRRLLVDEYLDNRHEKTAQSNHIRSRSLPKKSNRLMLDEYLENRLEKEAQSKLSPRPIRNRSLINQQEAQMPRNKKAPEVIREYADATPRRARVYVDGLAHALKDYAKANNLPEIAAIAAKLKYFMRFEDSLENFFVHGMEDRHPDFKEFFSALIAQPHFRDVWGDEAASILKQEFEPIASPHLPNGYSLWSCMDRKPYRANQRASVA